VKTFKKIEKACRKCRHWVPYTYPYGYLPDHKKRETCETWLFVKTKCPIMSKIVKDQNKLDKRNDSIRHRRTP
jgi:hypothetical protein